MQKWGAEKMLMSAMEHFSKMLTTNLTVGHHKSQSVPAGNPGVWQFLVLRVGLCQGLSHTELQFFQHFFLFSSSKYVGYLYLTLILFNI